MNTVQLIGRTTKDIELQATSKNTSFVKFTLAVKRPKREDGTPGADFIACTAWGKRAELLAKYVKKGDQLAVGGEIRSGSYEKDGTKHYTTEVNVTEVEFLTKKEKPAEVSDDDEACPF